MQSPFLHNEQPLTLERFPLIQVNRSLQAWDSADEYVLSYLNENQLLNTKLNIAIFNDGFGALAINLHKHNVQAINDSFISHQGAKHNFINNSISLDNVSFLKSTDSIEAGVDIIVIKLPKSNAFLAHQLQQIQQIANKDTLIIGAARAKDIHTNTLKLFEKHIGETKTSLAIKKSRLIFSVLDPSKKQPLSTDTTWQISNNEFGLGDLTISNKANVFSRDSLDIGGRFLLQNLPTIAPGKHVFDLGCGNGVIGIGILAKNPRALVSFFDESYMAIASAQENVQRNMAEQLEDCQFNVNDCLTDVSPQTADLILCNPPFHQQQAVTDHIAWQMFQQSYQALKKGGELRIIGNRQLAYHVKLKRLFGHSNMIASNKKFVVLSAKK